MLEKALAETDPETTGIVVMTAKLVAAGEASDRSSRTWTPTISS